jgi:hypothetical protein
MDRSGCLPKLMSTAGDVPGAGTSAGPPHTHPHSNPSTTPPTTGKPLHIRPTKPRQPSRTLCATSGPFGEPRGLRRHLGALRIRPFRRASDPKSTAPLRGPPKELTTPKSGYTHAWPHDVEKAFAKYFSETHRLPRAR